MPKERKKVLCMDAQRHAEYYGMQQTFDELYAKSKAGEVFNGLMELVLSPDNIMLAYRNIKTNTGSYTAGTDKQNIGDIGRLPPAEVIGKVRKIVTGSEHGYRPKQVRRKDIPKPNGKPGRWVFPASGTDWCNSASNKSWNPSVKLSSATTAMGSARIGQWSTQSPVLTPCYSGRIYTMFWSLTSRDSLTM